MRGVLDGLSSAHPLGLRLPGVFVADDFTTRFVSAFDEVLAPVFATLDCLDAYLDPALAPADFLDWLAGWVALDLDDGVPVAERRALLAHAVELHRWRGTARGLAAAVRLLVGGGSGDVTVTVTDSGGCAVSTEPGSELPGESPSWIRVTVRVDSGSTVDQSRLRAAVAAAIPAHVSATVEVLP